MRKRVICIVLLVVLIGVMALGLTGCSGNVYQRRLQRAKYQSIERDQGTTYLFTNEDGSKEFFDLVWRIKGTKLGDDAYYSVTVYRFENSAHAKKVEKYEQEHPTMLNRAVYRMDELVFVANSKEALRDVLYIVG